MKNRLPSINDINVGDLLFLSTVVVHMIISKPVVIEGVVSCSLFNFPRTKVERWLIGRIVGTSGEVVLFYDLCGME